jgi:hypothetical protein
MRTSNPKVLRLQLSMVRWLQFIRKDTGKPKRVDKSLAKTWLGNS